MSHVMLVRAALAAAVLGASPSATVAALEGEVSPSAAAPSAAEPAVPGAGAPPAAAAPAPAAPPGPRAPASEDKAPTAPTPVGPTATAPAVGPSAEPASGTEPAKGTEPPEGVSEARPTAPGEPLDERRGELAPRPEPAAAPEGLPTGEPTDHYLEQRRAVIDAQRGGTDPWGQYRRDWREGRRQLRRDSHDLFRAAPGFPGYPWGPVAPYYGSPWGEPTPPTAPSREATDEFFQRQHEAIEQQHGWKAPWTPYRGAVPGDPRGMEERMLRRNPWAPPPPQP